MSFDNELKEKMVEAMGSIGSQVNTKQYKPEIALGESRKMDADDMAHTRICILLQENNALKKSLEEQRATFAEREIQNTIENIQNRLARKYKLDLSKGRISLDPKNGTISYLAQENVESND